MAKVSIKHLKGQIHKLRFNKCFDEKSPFIQRHLVCNSGQNIYFLTGFVTYT